MKLRNVILGIVCSAGLFLGPQLAFAALDYITISTNPQTPGPNQPVTVSIQSYTMNLNSSKITWYENKEAMKEGIGETKFDTQTKGAGEPVTVDVVIVTQDGARYTRQIILTPVEVDILWEANTYVPPFYKGKALPTYKSIVKVSAIPRFNSLTSDPKDYYYKWTINRSQGAGEGLGRSSIPVGMGWPNSNVPITVQVSAPNKSEKGQATQYIQTTDGKILFYEQAPLLGVLFDHALQGPINADGNEFRVRAVPYFFSIDNYFNGDLVYSWMKNSSQAIPEHNPNILVIEKDGKQAQSASVNLTVQNAKRVLQQSNNALFVNFAEEQ